MRILHTANLKSLPFGLWLPAVLLMFLSQTACPRSKVKTGPDAVAGMKEGLHTIQMAVERYAKDNNGIYPATADDLLSRKFLDAWPTNPLTGKPMKPVAWGERSPGDFFYWTDEHHFAYCLGAYDSDPTGGKRGSGVADAFYGGIDPSEAYSPPLPDVCKP